MKRFKKEENMRKGVILSMVAALSLGLLDVVEDHLVRLRKKRHQKMM